MLKNMPMPGKKKPMPESEGPSIEIEMEGAEEMPEGEEEMDLESLGQEESPLAAISDEELIMEMKKRKLSV